MNRLKALFWIVAAGQISPAVLAAPICELVDNGKRLPFDGKSLSGVQVDKKSMTTLNRLYPNLDIIEKVFKGEISTCTNCSEKYVVCTLEDK